MDEVMRLGLHGGTGVFRRKEETPEIALSTRGKVSVYKPGSVLTRIQTDWHLDLGFSSPQNLEKCTSVV